MLKIQVITVIGTEGQHPVKTGIGSRTVTHPAKQAAFSGNLVKFTLAVQVVGLKVRPGDSVRHPVPESDRIKHSHNFASLNCLKIPPRRLSVCASRGCLPAFTGQLPGSDGARIIRRRHTQTHRLALQLHYMTGPGGFHTPVRQAAAVGNVISQIRCGHIAFVKNRSGDGQSCHQNGVQNERNRFGCICLPFN